jgi:DNA polymerase III epsilon subunit-like protein
MEKQERRKWTKKEIELVYSLRKRGMSWGEIKREVKSLGDSVDPENIRAAFRRFVGAKTSAYANLEPIEPVDIHFYVDPTEMPRIAVLDIETLPMKKYARRLFDDFSSAEDVIVPTCMLSWAGKLLNGHEIVSDILTPEEAKSRDTKRITKSLWEYLSGCDIVIGHNYSKFDVKHINTEFLKHGLDPLKYLIVDTLAVAKQNFRFDSNKMKFINGVLGIRNKIDNDGFPLWVACDNGDPEALATMLEYNEGDLGATEDLFYKVRSYIRNMNIALYTSRETSMCPICGSTEVSIEGSYHTPAGLWTSYRCEKCRSLTRGKYNHLTASKKKILRINS